MTAMTTRTRSAYRALTAVTTGMVTFGAVAGTGWVTAESARAFQTEKGNDESSTSDGPADQPVVQVVEKRRPHRTVVRTVVVDSGSARGSVVVSPGTGGGLSSSGSGSGPGSSAGSGSAPAPAPAAAPAPSSGS